MLRPGIFRQSATLLQDAQQPMQPRDRGVALQLGLKAEGDVFHSPVGVLHA